MRKDDAIRLRHMLDAAWRTVQDDLPPLLEELREILGEG